MTTTVPNWNTPIQQYKGIIMKLNRQNFAEFFRTDYNLISVIFAEGNIGRRSHQIHRDNFGQTDLKRYTYKIRKEDACEIGDEFLVCTSNDLSNIETLKVVKVVLINVEPEIEEESPFEYKWVVGRLDDVLINYKANIEKDNNLKRAVHKLEQALERVSLRKQLQAALDELPQQDREELATMFGVQNLLGNDDGKESTKES
jgi:hypothetical protein